MHRQTLWVTLACLLHDAGQLVQRAGRYEAGWLQMAEDVPQQVLDCVVQQQPEQAGSSCSPIACMMETACRIAAPSAGGKIQHGASVTGRTPALMPVFAHLNGTHEGYFLEAKPQDGVLRMPRAGLQELEPSDYEALALGLKQSLKQVGVGSQWIAPLLSVLECYTSSVPFGHCAGENTDIALYDHLKMTAAVGACISEFLLEQEEMDRCAQILENGEKFDQVQAFLLYAADFSGIQKFIYTITAKGALRTLRSRSFFLEFAMEHYVDELLCACGVSRSNLLYSGGGHCYLLLPNTRRAREAADAWNRRFNEWLFAQFGTRLFLAHGYTACSANELTNTPAAQAPYKGMFRRVSAQVVEHKMHRVTADQLRRLNDAQNMEQGRECAICGRADRLVQERERCEWCALFEDLPRRIQTCGVCFVSAQEDAPADFTLPAIQGQVRVSLTDEQQARCRLTAGEPLRRLYMKNAACVDLPNSTSLYVGDYAAANSMEELAQSAQGVRRLAVCRMDVDDLGQAFVAGFERMDEQAPERRSRYVTIARTAAFSRQMSLFFKRYINGLLSGEYGHRQPLQVAIVYSGGDDVFLVGAWNDVLEGAVRIRQALKEYTCGALTISAGVGVFNDHFPIRTAALQTAELEDAAKSIPGKNAVALFGGGMENAYPWDVFVKEIQQEKLAVLEDFFGEKENGRGNSMLYQMLALLRDANQDRMPLARYAYLLARLAPGQKAGEYEQYRKFSQAMYKWALSQQDRRQLITAISIYVYHTRKGD